jgi:hypothetical protein
MWHVRPDPHRPTLHARWIADRTHEELVIEDGALYTAPGEKRIVRETHMDSVEATVLRAGQALAMASDWRSR